MNTRPWRQLVIAMPSASGANARFRFWSSSTALAILGARAIRACCVSTVVGTTTTEPMQWASSANSEGMRIRWCGRASNPVGDVNRFPVGSTPATFRHSTKREAMSAQPSSQPRPRLTSLSHGGGCGSKISPGVLADLLQGALPHAPYADLLVGADTADDAAVYRLNDEQAIVATTDFFMPIVDDPFDFGRIAATNALSDIYAMGARPLLALAIVGMPINVLPQQSIREILRGGETVCEQAGIPVAGGHSIDSVEPIYGLAVTGVVDPRKVKRNSSARAGDVLILSKPLGVGIFSAAFKKCLLDDTGYRAMIETATQLNL